MKRQFINTVKAAVRLLNSLDVETIETDGGWILRGVGFGNDGVELTCDSDAELIDYARSERDILLRTCRALGVDSFADLPQYSSSSPMAEVRELLLAAWVYGSLSEDNKEAKT